MEYGTFKPFNFCFDSNLLQMPGGVIRKESQKNKKRVVKLVTSVTIIFALSWLPIQLILFIKSFTVYEVTIFNISLQVSDLVQT